MKNMKWVCSVVLALMVALTVAVIPVQAASIADLEDNLLLYYDFEGSDMYENMGTLGEEYNAYPTVGDYHRPDDAESNGTVTSKEGLGKAADFVADSYTFIQIPPKALIQAEDDITVSFWYEGNDPIDAGERRVFDFIGNGVQYWLDIQVCNGCMVVNISDSAQVVQHLWANTVSSAGWHMYTLTITRGDATDVVNFYVDGALADSANTYKVFDYYTASQNDGNSLDNFNGLGGTSFGSPLADGAIDEVRFYDVALSADQVESLYADPFATETEDEGSNENEENQGNNNNNQGSGTQVPETGDISMLVVMLSTGLAAVGGMKLKRK